jgi:hypothetical protein
MKDFIKGFEKTAGVVQKVLSGSAWQNKIQALRKARGFTSQAEKVLPAQKWVKQYSQKRLADASLAKRQLNQLKGKPIVTVKDRYPWQPKATVPPRTATKPKKLF